MCSSGGAHGTYVQIEGKGHAKGQDRGIKEDKLVEVILGVRKDMGGMVEVTVIYGDGETAKDRPQTEWNACEWIYKYICQHVS